MLALFLGVIVAVVTADLITKFTIAGITNSGIAWGLGANLPWLWIVITVVAFVLAGGVIGWYVVSKKRTWLDAVGLGLFVGGVLGNAIDRLISGGAVHDFIDFGLFKNNLADIAITVGAVLVMINIIVEGVRAAR